MGTNYYVNDVRAPCECCGQTTTRQIHIGKSSIGWVFALNTHPDLGLVDLESWISFLVERPHDIVDEYGQPRELGELLCNILDRPPRQDGQPLMRSPVDGTRVLKNGYGTYDLCRGEFS